MEIVENHEHEKLNDDWINNFEKTDKLYQDFYKDDVYYANLQFIYLNRSNEIDKITIDERHEKIVELYDLLKDEKKLNKLTNVIYINDLEEYKSYDYKHNSILIKEITNSDFYFFKVNKTVKNRS